MTSPHWLPARHFEVTATLAHADELIAELGRILFEYQSVSSGVIKVREEEVAEHCYLVVDKIAPIPQKVPLITADALNVLRAALEHTIYIEASALADGVLDESSAKLVEMPAALSEESFIKWTQSKTKKGPSAFRPGAELHQRIYDLQPLHRYADPMAHPLARLVAYTNHAKHRTPAVTAVLVPVVVREDMTPKHPRDLPIRSEEPIRIGDVIFSAPKDQTIPLALFPTVGISLPGTNRWPVLMNELGEIADWVRRQAIPRLVAGLANPTPEIPAHFDISIGYEDWDVALASSSSISAFERSVTRLQARTTRSDLVGIVASMPGAPSPEKIRTWLESLPDPELMTRMREIRPVPEQDNRTMRLNYGALERMRDDAIIHSGSDGID